MSTYMFSLIFFLPFYLHLPATHLTRQQIVAQSGVGSLVLVLFFSPPGQKERKKRKHRNKEANKQKEMRSKRSLSFRPITVFGSVASRTHHT